MALARVRITVGTVGDAPTVTVDDVPVPAVVGFYVRQVADGLAAVGLEFRAGTVDLDLPAGVTAAAPGPGVSAFVASIDAEQLEADILAQFDSGLTGSTGAAAKAVLAQYAADADQ